MWLHYYNIYLIETKVYVSNFMTSSTSSTDLVSSFTINSISLMFFDSYLTFFSFSFKPRITFFSIASLIMLFLS